MTPDEKAKWSKVFAEYDAKTASSMYALRSIAHHFVENEILIERDAQNEVQKNLPKLKPPTSDDEISEFMFERDQARQLHDETLIPMHRYSCIVMLYITVERELRRLTDNLQVQKKQKLKVKELRGSCLEQTNKFLAVFYDFEISQCPQYQALHDLQKIRNCIVHCQGDLALCNDQERDYLVKLKGKYKGLFAHPKSHVDMKRACIKDFLIKAAEFFIWVFQQLQQHQPVEKLNWKINPSAELKVLEKILARIE
jgi:hypothetical protein